MIVRATLLVNSDGRGPRLARYVLTAMAVKTAR
jgi:hypothetical protein